MAGDLKASGRLPSSGGALPEARGGGDSGAGAASGTAPNMLRQAQVLMSLYPQADRTYLDGRIRTETAGDHGIDDIFPDG